MATSAETWIAGAEIWVAVASVFVSIIVAVCALSLTVCQNRQNHKHNKLSVRPILTTSGSHNLNGNIGSISHILKNAGVGPAIIKNFIVFHGDEKVVENNNAEYETFINQIASKNRYSDVSKGYLIPGASMPVNSEHLLFSFNYDTKKPDGSFDYNKINIVVDYQSIYQDDVFTYDSRDDQKFHEREIING